MVKEEDTVSPEIYEYISRGALLAGILFSLAYAISGILVFIVIKPAPGIDPMLYTAAVLPLIFSVLVGIHQIWIKWVRYSFSERHVLIPLIGAILSGTMVGIAYFWPMQIKTADVFFFPVSQLFVSMVMLGYPLTHSHRFSLASSAATVCPVFIFFVVAMYGFFARQPVGFGTPLLAVLYLFSGILMSLGGSLHHMGTISTTFVRVKQVVEVDEGEVKLLKEEINSRDNELKRIEKFMDTLKDITFDNYKQKLVSIEGESPTLGMVKLGVLSLVQNLKNTVQEQTVSIREVERLTAKERVLQQKENDLLMREKNISEQLAELTRRSSDLTLKEIEIKKKEDALSIREMEVSAREKEVSAKEENARNLLKEANEKYEMAKKGSESLKEKEITLENMKTELEGMKKDIQTKEEQIKAKEEQLRVKEEQILKVSSNIAVQKEGLKAREDALAKREQELRAREEAIALKDREISSLPYDEMKRMKEELAQKEMEIKTREGEISVLRSKLEELQKSLESRVEEMQGAKAEYDRALAKFMAREKEIAKKEEELDILRVKLETRERELAIRESELEKRAGHVYSQSRAEERAQKLIERLKMSKEIEERISGETAENETGEPGASLHPKEGLPSPEKVDQVSPVSMASPHDEGRPEPPEKVPALPMYMRPRAKEPSPSPEPVLPRDGDEKSADNLTNKLDMMIQSAMLEPKGAPMERISTGIERLDELLGGGIPIGRMVLFLSEAYIGSEAFIHKMVSRALDEGIRVVYISTRRGIDEIYNLLLEFNPRVREYAAMGSIRWIDLFSPVPVHVPFTQYTSTMRMEVVSMTEVFLQIDSYAEDGCMIVVESASPLVKKGKFELFVRDIASAIKKKRGIAIFRVESGIHTPQEIENLRHMIHGCISFRREGTKTLLQVEGIPGIKSGSWIEYQVRNTEITLGSFALERI